MGGDCGSVREMHTVSERGGSPELPPPHAEEWGGSALSPQRHRGGPQGRPLQAGDAKPRLASPTHPVGAPDTDRQREGCRQLSRRRQVGRKTCGPTKTEGRTLSPPGAARSGAPRLPAQEPAGTRRRLLFAPPLPPWSKTAAGGDGRSQRTSAAFV